MFYWTQIHFLFFHFLLSKLLFRSIVSHPISNRRRRRKKSWLQHIIKSFPVEWKAFIYQIKRIIFQKMNLTCFTGRNFFFLSRKFMIVVVFPLQLICFPMMIDEGVKRWIFFSLILSANGRWKCFFPFFSEAFHLSFSRLFISPQTFHNQLRSPYQSKVTVEQVLFLSHNLCDFHPLKVRHVREIFFTYFTLSLSLTLFHTVPRDHHNKSMKNGFINLL